MKKPGRWTEKTTRRIMEKWCSLRASQWNQPLGQSGHQVSDWAKRRASDTMRALYIAPRGGTIVLRARSQHAREKPGFQAHDPTRDRQPSLTLLHHAQLSDHIMVEGSDRHGWTASCGADRWAWERQLTVTCVGYQWLTFTVGPPMAAVGPRGPVKDNKVPMTLWGREAYNTPLTGHFERGEVENIPRCCYIILVISTCIVFSDTHGD